MNHKVGIAIATTALLALVLAGVMCSQNKKGEINYKDVTVTRGDLEVTVEASGVIQPENRLEIKAPVAGRADKVLVSEGDHVKKGQVLAWVSTTERAAVLDAAGAQGENQTKIWEDYYKATPVLAPLRGTIIQRNIQPGQTFSTSDAILVMSDRLTIQAQVDETDISQIKLKQHATVTLDAYPDEEIEATVAKIAYDAKIVSNVTTYAVNVTPKKTPPFMRSGMTANVNFTVDSKENILLLPSEAIKRERDGSAYVLVQLPGNAKPIPKPIEIGVTDGMQTEIISGLKEGNVVKVPKLKLAQRDSSESRGSNPFSPFGRGRPHR